MGHQFDHLLLGISHLATISSFRPIRHASDHGVSDHVEYQER